MARRHRTERIADFNVGAKSLWNTPGAEGIYVPLDSSSDVRSDTAPLAPLVGLLFGNNVPNDDHQLGRRIEPRYSISLPVVVRTLDSQSASCGPPIRATTRDISNRGLSIQLPECHLCDLLAQIAAGGIEVTVVLHVAHSSPCLKGFVLGGPISPWPATSSPASSAQP